MKSRIHSFLFSIVILLGVGLCAMVGLTSCENFLRGADVRKQLEDSIAYANAKSCKVYLKSDTAMGSFLADGEKDFKVGFATDIQFTLNKDDYYFVSLEAVCVNDETQSRAEFVEFTLDEKASDLEKGIYVTKVKLLKEANDIQIRPKCIELPCVKSYSPETKGALYANTPIVITFNMPVEDAATTREKSLFKYPNISLIYYGSDGKANEMYDYFDEPEFNNDKTVLTIKPIGSALKDFVVNKAKVDSIDVVFSFSDAITVKNQDKAFPIKNNYNSNFSVRFNSYTEDVAPECKDFFLTNEYITTEFAPNLDDQLKTVLKTRNEFTEENDIKSNLMASTFYIYGKYYDKDSGVRTIEVKERYVYDSISNNPPSNNPVEIVSLYTIHSQNVESKTDGDGNTSFVITYTLQETLKDAPGRGCFDITVTVKDGCGNSAEEQKLCIVNMDYSNLARYKYAGSTGYTEKSFFYNFNKLQNTPSPVIDQSTGLLDFDKYSSDIKTLRIKDEQTPAEIQILTGNATLSIPCNEVDYYCEYINSSGKKTRVPFSDYDENVKERFATIKEANVSNLPFTIIVEYKGAGLGRKSFVFPPEEPIVSSISSQSISMSGNGNKFFKVTQASNGYCTIEFINGTTNLTFENNYKYYVGYYSSLDGVYLHGNVTGPFYKGCVNANCSSSAKPECEYRLSQSQKGLVDITLEFNSGLWNTCDSVLLNIQKFSKKETSNGNTTIKYIQVDTLEIKENKTSVKNNKVCYTFPVEEEWFYKNGEFFPLKLYLNTVKQVNLNGNIISLKSSESKELSIEMTPTEKVTFDNMKPSGVYSQKRESISSMRFNFYDNGSGPKTCNFWINDVDKGSTIKTDSDNTFYKIFYFYEFAFGDNILKYEIEDQAENTTIGTIAFNPAAYTSRILNGGYTSFGASSITLNETSSSLKIYEFDESNGWKLYNYTVSNKIVTLDSGNFYRVEYPTSNNYYYYDVIRAVSTSDQGNKNSHYIQENGSSKKSVVVASGSNKVLLTVFQTSEPYDVCKNWDANTWKMMARSASTKLETLTTKNVPQVYDFSGVLIGTNTKCYCVVANFANGSSAVSHVWER